MQPTKNGPGSAADRSARKIEDGVQRDFSGSMSYGDYLDLDQLLSAQHLRSEPPQHDCGSNW